VATVITRARAVAAGRRCWRQIHLLL